MAQKKKQHYVPKCLLKNFTKDDKFFVFNVRKNTIIDKMVPYSNHCYTDYLYGKNSTVDDWLTDKENEISPIFQLIINNQSISEEQESVIKQYVFIQYLRTEKMIDMRLEMIEDAFEQLIPIIAKSEGISVNKYEAASLAKVCVAQKTPRAEIVNSDMDEAKKGIESFDDLHMIILNAPLKSLFVCSDHPVFMANLYQSVFGMGFLCAGIIVIMPISPRKCIILYDDGIYDYKKDKVVNLSDSEIDMLNYMQYNCSRDIVFSTEKQILINLKSHFEHKYIDEKLRNDYQFLKDPFAINAIIQRFKEKYPMNPKYDLEVGERFIGLLDMKIKDSFIPFINDLNGSFDRYIDINNIPSKYYGVGNNYVEVIKDYAKKRNGKIKTKRIEYFYSDDF